MTWTWHTSAIPDGLDDRQAALFAATQLIAAAQPISPQSVPFITEETLRTAQKFLEWLEEENEVPEDDDEK